MRLGESFSPLQCVLATAVLFCGKSFVTTIHGAVETFRNSNLFRKRGVYSATSDLFRKESVVPKHVLHCGKGTAISAEPSPAQRKNVFLGTRTSRDSRVEKSTLGRFTGLDRKLCGTSIQGSIEFNKFRTFLGDHCPDLPLPVYQRAYRRCRSAMIGAVYVGWGDRSAQGRKCRLRRISQAY
jgi:hypothetical protein